MPFLCPGQKVKEKNKKEKKKKNKNQKKKERCWSSAQQEKF